MITFLRKLFGLAPTFNKKGYFQQMVVDMQRAIAELELKRFTLLNTREVQRQKLDDLGNILADLKNREQTKEVKEQIKQVEKEHESWRNVVDAIDRELIGAPESDEFPNGKQGVDQQLKQWHDRMEVAKLFIKTNC